jgi:hypothetical protein
MRIHLTRDRGPYLAAFAVFVAFFVGAAPQIPNMWQRPACADTVMHAVSSSKPVHGTFACFNSDMQTGLQSIGISSDRAFAERVGTSGDYHYVNKTADGGYVYEYDRPLKPHDRVRGALAALAVTRTAADVRRGDLRAALGERPNLGAAWAEITGATQNEKSTVFTFYLDGNGKITAVK